MRRSQLSFVEWNRRHRLLCAAVATALVVLSAALLLGPGDAHEAAYLAVMVTAAAAVGAAFGFRIRSAHQHRLEQLVGLAARHPELLATGEPLAVIGRRGECIYLNQGAAHVLGVDMRRALGANLDRETHQLDGTAVRVDATALPGDTGWRAIRFTPVTVDQRLVEDLRRGIEAGELVVHYQPKVDLARGTCRGAEALVRWQHPERGLLFPDQFIPLAERHGLTAVLTERVVDEALAQCAAWQQAGRPVAVAVNVDPDTLSRTAFPDRVAELIKHHGVSPFLFELEVTETAVAERPDDVRTAVEYLKRLGVATSVDDFGTGYSSMTQLADLPVKTLKIDRTFVMDMPPGGKNEAIVRSTIALAKRLRLRTVAEGVEDAPTARRLHAMGCTVGQGYFWSRPLPAETFAEWLAGYEPVSMGAAEPMGPVAGRRRRPTDDDRAGEDVLRAALRLTQACSEAINRDTLTDALSAMVVGFGGALVGDDDVLTGDVIDVDVSLGSGGLYPKAAPGSLERQNIEAALNLTMPTVLSRAARLEQRLSA